MKAEPLRVVVDTKVWISAALSKTGAPAQLVRYVLAHGIPVFTRRTFDELQSRLWKPKFDRYLSMELRKNLLHDASAAAFWADVPPTVRAQTYSRDPDDDAFVHAALAAEAPWLVTGDQDLLSLPPIARVQIVTPAMALGQRAFGALV